ncbi:MAG: class I SAM-dependent methyltransferase [Oscillospiraceae bacterium]|jgi:hypothetical protein|nr:class I SAM-dependent methyltransferase [Oscillospiraceae bacterium]
MVASKFQNNVKESCRLCGSEIDNYLIIYEGMPKSAQNFPDSPDEDAGEDLSVIQCPWCGLVQLAGSPVPYYRDVIRASAVSAEMREFRKNQFSLFVRDNNLFGKKIIEIGAGNGEYMSAFENIDAHIFGLENSKNNSASIYKGFVENECYYIPNSPYDAFYCLNFLEHIPSPKSFLRGIVCNLTEDGVGIIEVPNTDMIFKTGLFSEFIHDHLMYFTKDTFRLMLETNGFSVVSLDVIWHNYIISAVVKKKHIKNVNNFLENRKTLTDSIHAYLDQKSDEGKIIASWGAGHQALAVLALSGIGGKIQYVIDSADFKQNKLTPATHIPIISPSKINELGIDCIIVMAASYSSEVVKLINENYTHIEVAVIENNKITEVSKKDCGNSLKV